MKIKQHFFFIWALLISFTLPSLAVYADTLPVITKNPTSEAIAIGGKTWFIAHADNALSMTWELVDPYGNIYTLMEAMTMNPGLKLQALDGDTIAVSNVPQSVNGWGVQATFLRIGRRCLYIPRLSLCWGFPYSLCSRYSDVQRLYQRRAFIIGCYVRVR